MNMLRILGGGIARTSTMAAGGLLLASLLVGGCGQKGPLYLPPVVVPTEAPSSTPAATPPKPTQAAPQ